MVMLFMTSVNTQNTISFYHITLDEWTKLSSLICKYEKWQVYTVKADQWIQYVFESCLSQTIPQLPIQWPASVAHMGPSVPSLALVLVYWTPWDTYCMSGKDRYISRPRVRLNAEVNTIDIFATDPRCIWRGIERSNPSAYLSDAAHMCAVFLSLRTFWQSSYPSF